jgi:hypothetical protein
MLKLYKRIEGVLQYHEAWTEEDNGVAVEHWGIVGDRGESKSHPYPNDSARRISSRRYWNPPLGAVSNQSNSKTTRYS